MNKPKRTGTSWETEVVRYLLAYGIECERRALNGSQDKGDIAGIDGWMLEAKSHRDISLAAFMDQVVKQTEHAQVPNGAAIIKRRGKSAGQGYVVMELRQFAELLRHGGW